MQQLASTRAIGRIPETEDGCWAVLGSPGEFPNYSSGYLAQIGVDRHMAGRLS